MQKIKFDSEILGSVLKYLVPISILISGSLILGIFSGIQINKSKTAREKINSSIVSANIDAAKNNLIEVLQNIERFYITDVDFLKISKISIKDLVEKIDPFGAYIGSDVIKNEKYISDDMESVGTVLAFYKGVPQVVGSLWGSGSEECGLRPGDVIIKIDEEDISKQQYNEREINIKLLGSLNSKINITVRRKWEEEPINFSVPILKSLHKKVYYCSIKNNMGYIKLSYFNQGCSKDFFVALNSLIKQNIKNVIIDLRSNAGGEVDESINIADKLLDDGRIICSVRGKLDSYNNTYYAKGQDQYKNIKFMILVDGGTAGAAEVLAGAMQDNDRAIVVGTKRTFGRAIIRHSVQLQDGSEIMITAAKYYTPSGRPIHKLFQGIQGISEDNMFSGDYQKYSIGYYKTDSVSDNENVFRTVMGRIVKGGGGIMPDFIIIADSSHYPLFLDKINGIIKEIAKEFAAENSSKLSKISFEEYSKNFEVPNILIDQISTKAEQAGIHCDSAVFSNVRQLIRDKLKIFIAQFFWKDDSYIRLIVKEDEVISKCQKIFDETSILDELN